MAGIQISGLASGLDTAAIIEKLMSVEQRPLILLQENQVKLAERRSAFGDISSKLSALRTNLLKLQLSSNVTPRTATSTDTTVATATASSSAAVQSIDFEVVSLGTKTQVTSATSIGGTITGANTLDSGVFNTTPTAGTFTVKVGNNSQTITIGSTSATLQSVVNDINSAFGAGANTFAQISGNTIVLDSTLGGVGGGTLVLGTTGDTSNFLTISKLGAAPGTTSKTSTGSIGVVQPGAYLNAANIATAFTGTSSFDVNGVTFNYNSATDTLNGLITQINNSAANVTASYDTNTDKFTLQSKTTGATSISLTDTGGLLAALGVTGAQTTGANVSYKVNGGAVQYSTSNTLSNVVSGVTVTAKAVGTTTIEIKQDVTTAVNTVKDFITAFNEANSLIRSKVAIDPATGQRGIFAGDPFIQGMEYKLRSVVNTAASISTAYKSFGDIGVSTGAVGSAPGTTNELELNETKLTAALTDDPDSVYAFLTATGGPVATLNTYVQGVTSFTGPLSSGQRNIDTQLRNTAGRILDVQRRLEAKQTSLEKKFADLESAMAQLQSQSASLSSQLSGLSSG